MEFGVLGTVMVRQGRAVLSLRRAMPRTVIATLLLDANRMVSTTRLTDALWGDRPPPSAAASLQNHIAGLRTLLGAADRDRIQTTASGYLIRVEPGELDLDTFTELSERGFAARRAGDWETAATNLGAALALRRDTPLADVTSARLQEVDVPRLRQALLTALEARIDADLHLGRQESVIGELGGLVAAYPLHEGFHRSLMLACYQTGHRADALAAYRHARRLFREELGVEPGAELRQLHQRMLSADLSPAGPAAQASASIPCQLPADIPDFAGRVAELELLRNLFGAAADRPPGVVPVAVITGTGGSGKTTLALHAAHQIKARYADGQLYVNLRAALGARPAGEVLPRLLRDLGVDSAKIPAGEDEQAGLFRTMLSRRDVLLVLDDAKDASQVRPLLPGSARCGVLVTSRSHLAGLAGAHLGLDGLECPSAHALFASIVGVSRMETEPSATAEVIRLTAGLPLAIRIAGARLAARPGWTIASLAERLSDQARLDELRIDDLAVRSSFQLSYADLLADPDPARADLLADPDPARADLLADPGPARADPARADPAWRGAGDPARAFRLLGLVDSGDLSLPGAAALLATTAADAHDLLERLVDAHLLESPAADRYRMHDLLHIFAAEQAHAEESADSRTAAVRRLVSWYLRTADAAVAVLEPRIERVPLSGADPLVQPLDLTSYDNAITWCETERANLVAATKLAARHHLHALAWQLPVALRRFFRLGKYWADWIASCEVALASARAIGDRAAQGRILNSMGEPYADLGRYDDAVRVRAEAVEIARDTGDLRDHAAKLINLGVVLGITHRHAEALAHVETALHVFEASGDSYNEARALTNIGTLLRLTGRYEEALTRMRQALTIHSRLGGTSYSYARSLTVLAEIYYDTEHYEDAEDCYRRSMTMCRALHDRGGEAIALEGLGMVSVSLNRGSAARLFWSRALAIFTEIGDPQAALLRTRLADLTAGRQTSRWYVAP
jgi:DNA-binding SARP family transcriptional activator